MQTPQAYLHNVDMRKQLNKKLLSIVISLSLVTILCVFWGLKMQGITIAGDAFCGNVEHTHTDECKTLVCDVSDTSKHTHTDDCYEITCKTLEHTHTQSCYSDITADLETTDDWQDSVSGIGRGSTIAENIVLVAKSQLGVTESERNFQVDAHGIRRGITRYGQWYGNPYGDWSAMFVSFCLDYAGVQDVPLNAGVESMRIEWEQAGLYKPHTEYLPQPGEIVFFSKQAEKSSDVSADSVAIITSVNKDTITVIEGDVDNTVAEITYSNKDIHILGYGLVMSKATKEPISMTPFTITVSGSPIKKAPKRMATYASRAQAQNIKDYIESIGGDFDMSILDLDKEPIPPDENGDIVLDPNVEYLASISMRTGENSGILPGEYFYDLPEGVITVPGTGDITMTDGTVIGSWEINDTGNISLVFNQNANRYSDVLINITAGVMFNPDIEVELDGNIHVVVRPEQQVEDLLNVTKWGRGVKTDEEGNLLDANGNSYNHHILPWGEPVFIESGFDRAYWDVYITGNKENSLSGYVITDQIVSTDTHYYSQKDMEAGVVIKYSGADLNPNELHWITLKPGTDGFVWTENGFSYTMPQQLVCDDPHCSYKNQWINTNNDPITVSGNWIANIDYFSTMKPATENGWNEYSNKINVDKKVSHSSLGQTVSIANASIQKDGVFNGNTGEFQWLVSVNIPKQPTESITMPWALLDITKLSINHATAIDFEGSFYQPVKKMTAVIGDVEYEVPYITDIKDGERPPLAYCFGYVSDTPVTSMPMYLLRPCNCTSSDNCDTHDEMGRCASGDFWVGGELVYRDYGYCRCWNMEENVKLVIEYSSPGAPVIQYSKNQIGEYTNIINLNQVDFNYDEGWAKEEFVQNDSASDTVPVPSVFEKVLVSDPNKENSYIASYSITVNESKVDLTSEKSIRVEDTMSETLVYIPGSLVVKTEDIDGNVGQLVYGDDYTLTVGGSGNKLNIEIFNPQAVKYSFAYDCRITVPAGETSILFDNSAKITLFGEVFEQQQAPKQVTNVAASATTYRVNVQKNDVSHQNKPLPGALIGFFAQNGEGILQYSSNEVGQLSFETDISKGIIIREHTLYYVQEIHAPPGYVTDKTRHYLYFCDKSEPCDKCRQMANIENGENAIRVENGQPETVTLYNREGDPLLPSTGGYGGLIFYIIGLTLVISSSIFICSMRHKKERRLKS